jgi:C4-dicarboxylate transporter DctQ subunit
VHLGVDILVAKFKPDIRRWVILSAISISLLFTTGMFYLSIFYVLEAYKMELMTVDLEIPQWIPYLALPFGFGLISIRFLQVGWLVYTGKQGKITQSNEPVPDSDEELVISE